MKLRTGDPFMAADAYGRSLGGLSVNLLVRSVAEAVRFQRDVLGASIVYADPDFAVVRGWGGEWMLHADHTYTGHPMRERAGNDLPRGAGVELRLHGADPDAIAGRARDGGFVVLAGPDDKPHGLREAHILDGDGFVWVPDRPLA